MTKAEMREREALRVQNLRRSMELVHNNLGASEDELRRAVNDLGDEVRRLRRRHELFIERRAKGVARDE